MVELPPDAAELARRWNFEPTEELERGYCSRVFANDDWVLKLPWRGEEQISGWRMAVAMSGNGGPIVREFDPEFGALLMERIVPGTKLSQSVVSDEEGIELVLRFRESVLRVSMDGLLPISAYYSDPSPMARKLIESQDQLVPLHADLHHENILLGRDGWISIDPKGLYGDPAMEAAAYIRNPYPGLASLPELHGMLARRINRFAEAFACDPWRVWAWATIELEDSVPPDPWSVVREALLSVEPSRA